MAVYHGRMSLEEDFRIRPDEVREEGDAYARGFNGTSLRVLRHVHGALDDDPLREIPASAPSVRPFAGGTLATVVTRGPRTYNQDAQYASGGAFGIVDGMGGHSYGEVAAQILAKSLRDAPVGREGFYAGWSSAVRAASFRMGERLLELHRDHALAGTQREDFAVLCQDPVIRSVQFARIPPCAAVFCACAVHGGVFRASWLGDAQVALVRKGEVVHLTQPHRPVPRIGRDGRPVVDRATVEKCVESHRQPESLSYVEWPLRPGDSVVCASDGLWDQPGVQDALGRVSREKDLGVSARLLAQFALRAMGAPGGKPDNLGLHVWRAA